MRTADEWYRLINSFANPSEMNDVPREWIHKKIREIQIEVIHECADNVTMTHVPCGDIKSCGCEGICEHPYYTVNKQSILSLIEQVK